ncbi:single-stranded-DNA-specific exonuclease RecJ [Amaricoccus solimangrovi]|uniref:Single-stranded-DNA-specific exonuclease RecJ n=1 Tax=Amaricoccus solimangrovi TaxID=2589815 RepID=A0A501WUB0_9RHOB|nr:single-stranded-DNA-specific exonuclease RecJ [Amaricoccus solimangrovi]TPE49426.1 single-stranded-DNA-specific exonuclease RecJ [Amaricoccus solimangrovi]
MNHAPRGLAAGPAAESPAFLGVARSATGRRWIGPTPDQDRLARAIAQAAGTPAVVAAVLARRGVRPAEAAAYLAPSLRDLMPNPSRLRDMDRAAERLRAAVRGRERIAVFADYDVDGGASAALLIDWLRGLGLGATLYIPDRIDEGYGPNVPAMRALGAEHDLILCVDCGTLSFEPIAAAGCDVVVVDHHLAGETLPDALAVVNPNRQDEESGLGYLCAAGVVFLLLVAANRLLRAEGVTGPDLMGLLDLVALATVADVAPLTGLNRAFVRQGLRVMAGRGRPGVEALARIAGAKGEPTPYTLGFVLGPRVNAGGRIGAADLGARLLATRDADEAAALAERLHRLNGARRDLEAAVLAAAGAQVAARGDGEAPLVWAAGEGWHPGVVGIVAARLKEAHGRPSVVIGFDGEAGKGSARSIAGVDLGSAIARLAREGLIEKGGGHRMAAGLSLSRAQLGPAMDRLGELLAAEGAGAGEPDELTVEGMIDASAATPELAALIAAAGPFGAGSPTPRLVLAETRLAGIRRVGDGHLALRLGGAGTGQLEAMLFRAFATPLGELLENSVGARLHFAGRLERDDWGGRARAKLHLEDVAPV